ncbi:MAG: hypothetical protein ACT4O6_19515 [Reyranella sp.]
MNRRAFLFAAMTVSTIPVAARASSGLKVIYVGGLDCPPCTKWKNQYKAGWLASAEYRQVTWYEIDPPKLREAYQPRFWPDELKPILDQLPRKSGTPRFLIVRDGTVVSNEFGASKWTVVLADLKKILG